MTATEYLLARIVEDEAGASSHHRVLCMRTACDGEGCIWGADEQEEMERQRVCTCGYPARVLAGCEANRRIVELHSDNNGSCSTCTDSDYAGLVDDDWPCDTLRALASIWADRPDFPAELRAE